MSIEEFLRNLRGFEFATDDDGFTELVCKTCLDHITEIEDGDDLSSIVSLVVFHHCYTKYHPPVVRHLSELQKPTPEGERNNEH